MKINSLLIAGLFVVSACNSMDQPETKSLAKEPSQEVLEMNFESPAIQEDETAPVFSGFVPLKPFEDSLHRFIREADLRFRTKDVITTSLKIEQLAFANGGFVEHSEIRNEEKDSKRIMLNDGSDKEVVLYSTLSNITVRIPSENLSKVLLEIQPYAEYLDHRNLTSRNIAFDNYLKKLIQNRISVHSLRVLKDDNNKASDLDQLLEREMQSDREKVDEMRIDEQVAYSTVRLQVYGPEKVSTRIVPVLSGSDYEPGFFSKLGRAVAAGGRLVLDLVVLLVYCWPLWLVLFGGWYVFKRVRTSRRLNSKNVTE